MREIEIKVNPVRIKINPRRGHGSGNGIITGDRIGEGHIGVRFNDHWNPRNPQVWRVELDGGDVGNDCNEAIAGELGAVVLPDPRDPKEFCLVTGRVVISRILPEIDGGDGGR